MKTNNSQEIGYFYFAKNDSTYIIVLKDSWAKEQLFREDEYILTTLEKNLPKQFKRKHLSTYTHTFSSEKTAQKALIRAGFTSNNFNFGDEEDSDELSVSSLIEKSYDELLKLDVIYNYQVSKILNESGNPNMTVCPECHVDDFIHVEGCSKQNIVDELLNTL